jgi:predicted Fe-Mo cluster-binding NifX family protein
MKIAITSQNRKTITGHAGKCRKFWIFDLEDNQIVNKELLELPIEQAFHNSSPQQPHPLDNINILISGGMGQGLIRRLEDKGIQALITSETDPQQAIQKLLQGSLQHEADKPHEHYH